MLTPTRRRHMYNVLLSYSLSTHSKFIVLDISICTKIGESVKSLLILFFRDSQTSVSKIAAEIETCHRNVNYWCSSIGITGTVQNGQSSFELSRVDPNWQLWGLVLSPPSSPVMSLTTFHSLENTKNHPFHWQYWVSASSVFFKTFLSSWIFSTQSLV